MVKIIHNQVKGRARYKVKELYRSESLKKYLERSLSETSGINYVSANPSTSNILVIFEKEYSADKVALLIEQNISQYQKLANKSLEKYSSKTKKELTKATQKPIVNAQAQRIKNWHLMETDAVLTAFNTSKQSGLSSKSAAENLNKYGPNFLATAKTRSDLSILIDQFKSLPVALLGVAAGVSVFTRGLIDALVILGVVGLNAAIGYRTESQSERIIHSLGSHQETSTWVIRNGKQIEIPIEDVVIGDILVLKTGGYIAADARLLEAENLSVDESALTGESIPVTKSTSSLTGEDIPLADRTNMVYKGTLVTGGQGLAVVVATAKFTEMGKIQQLVGEATTTETPLTRQLNQVGSQLVAIGMGICGLVFGIGVLRGYGLLQMLQSSISLAVAAVPEGLPTIATTTLALGIQDMRQRNVLVRSLSAVEALGSVQTICLDKTGTITENRMSVVEVHTDSQQINVSEGEFIANGENINPYACDQLLKLIHVSVLCNESEVNQDQDGEYSIKGSATENALIHMAIAAGVNVTQLRQKYKLLHTNLRSENRNIMSTVHTTENHHNLVAVKGSPGEVAQICKFWFKDGEITTLTEQDRRAIEIENDRMAGKALRVLGIAYTILDENNNRQNPEQDLTWLGLVGMADPVRKGVKELIAQFHEAGIDTVMITGDQSPTAYAIAKELELSRESQLEILDSTDLNNLTPEALTALADKVDVF
ncbi:cation-translocating P-type ATPase, partial [Fischerella thermalis]